MDSSAVATHTTPAQPTWVVVGTGALGSLWAHGLQQAGAPVMVYSRHASDGPEIELTVVAAAAGTANATPACFPVIHSAAQAPANAIWLVMVKAWQLEPLLRQVFAELDSAPMQLILSHNGMGAADELLAQAQNARHVDVYDLVTTHGAWRQSRRSTIHAGFGESWLGRRRVTVALPEHAAVTGAASSVAKSGPQHALTRYAELVEPSENSLPPAWFKIFAQALPPLHWEANISPRRWHKLAINCVINPLATIAADVNGVLRKDEYQPKIRAICEEIGNLNPYLDADVLVAAVQQVIRATANNRCSMLQDSEAGKPTEIDYLNGFICQEGAHLNVATRVNCEIWQQLASSNTSKDTNEKE